MSDQPNKVSIQRPGPEAWSDRVKGPTARLTSDTHSAPASASRFRPVPLLLSLLIIGLAVYWLASQIESLEDSINLIRVMSLGLVALAGLTQIGSYLGAGYLLKVIADLGKTRVSLLRGTLITLASASIGVVAGGWAGTVAATYHWVARSEDTSEEAALAGLLPPLYNNILLTAVAAIGLVYLLMTGRLSTLQMDADGLFLAAVGLGLVIAVYSLCHQRFVERLVLGVAGPWLRLLRLARAVDTLREKINHTFRGLSLLRRQGWVRPALGAAINIGFDLLTLYLLFVATGQAAKVGVFLAGYGLTFLFGKVAYLLPGGIGVIESGMTAIYTSLGIPASTSVVVVLSYRLISFWIPVLLGFAVAGYLQRTLATVQQRGASPEPLPLTRRP
jgi:uncharacterized protein (TIRG00374 family)